MGWNRGITMKNKKLIVKLLGEIVSLLADDEPYKPKEVKASPYHLVYGQKFREIYDGITCGGKPIRGCCHQLTPTEFRKVVRRCHSYAKEQKALGYPDVR